MAYFEIFLALFALLFLSYYCFRNKYGLPTYWPFVGMLPALLQNHHRLHHFLADVLEKSELTFFIKGPWLSNFRLLVTADPANVHHVLSKNFGNYPKGPKFRETFESLGDGIFNSDGDLWQYHRNMAQTFFGHPQFQPFFLKGIWEKVENGLFPVLDHISKQGLEIDLQDLFQRWLGVGKERKLREADKVADDFIFDCISRKMEEMCKRSLSAGQNKVENEWKLDIMNLYIGDKRASSEIGSHTNKFLRDAALNFLVAGRDTTSTALSWFFYLLSKNPRVMSRIREELDMILAQAKYVHDFNKDDKTKGHQRYNYLSRNFAELSNKLIYLHCAVCETMRLYPPVAFNNKAPMEPDILPSGHQVDSSMQIILHIYAMGRMKSIWGEDCHEFKPERWISNKGSIKHEPSHKFLAFNAGPRTCLGKHMSLIQMKATAIAIISNYDIQPIEGHVVVPDSSVILRMKHGFKVKVLASQP
ncbi:hypothetical protein Cgig2_016370 [Carnegiea gigantea]|uniref:Cytochrome P450 n=1 Tax=Carnegiea gigantea TaxID=171969 RepID=A0A9Q1JH50_9CARY|nr:hypothetical protein Cgig2_016370 [Carnegiea gigantea]